MKEDWENLDPWARKLLKAVALIGGPLFLLALFDQSLVLARMWIVLVLFYFGVKVVRWALHTDQVDRDRRKVDQSLWDELKDIEGMVRDSIFTKKAKAFNSEGEPMTCIFCGSFTNKGGRYCDDHDE